MTKYVPSLWAIGPIRNEARRLAKAELTRHYNALGKRFDLLSKQQQENAITVLVYNAQEIWAKAAKHNLEGLT